MSKYIPMQIQYPSGCVGVNSLNKITIEECEQLPIAENSMQRFVYDVDNKTLITNWKNQCVYYPGGFASTSNCENVQKITYVPTGNTAQFKIPGTSSNNWVDYCYSGGSPYLLMEKCITAKEKNAQINNPSYVPLTTTPEESSDNNNLTSETEDETNGSSDNQKITNPETSKKKSSSLGMIIGIIVGVVVLIVSVGGGFYLYQKGILKL